MGVSSFEVTNSEYEIFKSTYRPSLDRMELGQNVSSCSDSVLDFVRKRTVSTLSFNIQLNDSHTCHNWACFASYLSFLEIGNLVTAVAFVNSFKAAFLFHRFCSSWAFFCRLVQESESLIRRNFISICTYNLSSCQEHGHVSIMATHMRMISRGLILQMRIIFRHRQRINISSDRNDFFLSTRLSFAPDVNN